ncbi:MAG: protein kinase [Candidatus Latescibacteria bacterium]|nr:protein kinase [Candidatus Latescibacterota bacterium]
MTENKNFKVLQTVASGGTAVLYKAIQVSLDRVVAVKRLHQHLTTDENFTRRFVLEAKAAASLDHENIVRVIDFGVEEDCYQMVMEFVEGESLKEVLERWRPVNWDLALAMVHQTCRGLEHAHSKGIVHRDVKPGNIMLTKSGTVKIADFGLAKLTQGASSHTAADSILGTPLYMSPEQAFGESVDQRSDLFSLGTVLFELITGRQPFASENYMGIIQNIVHKDIPPVREFNPEIPPNVEGLVTRALTKNRDQRFQSARDFRLAIETVLGTDGLNRALTALPALLERNTDTRLLTKGVSTPASTSSAARRRSSSSASWAGSSSAMRRKRRRAAGAWVAVASVLVLGGGAAGFMYRPQLRALGFSPSSAPASVQQADVSGGAGLGLDSALGGGFPMAVDSLRLAMIDSTVAPVDTTATPGDASAIVASTDKGDPRAPMVWTSPTASQPTAPAIDAPPQTAPAEEAKKPEKKVKDEEPAKVFREGYLSITVDPSCEVWVNGKYRGDASPTLRLTLPAGRQTIECRHPKSEPYVETIQIVSGELSRRNVTLKRLRGIISLATTEGAELYIDGQLIGITPILRPIEVEAGTHTVTIKKANFYAWTSEVVVEANDMLPLKITLSPRY